jgi:hypothetical protein
VQLTHFNITHFLYSDEPQVTNFQFTQTHLSAHAFMKIMTTLDMVQNLIVNQVIPTVFFDRCLKLLNTTETEAFFGSDIFAEK